MELYNEMPKLLDQFNIENESLKLFGHLNKTEQQFINYIVCSLINCGLVSLREIQKKK